MKVTIIVFYLSLIWSSSYGQELRAPKYFLNSKEFDFNKVYINPMSIDSIHVEKKGGTGEVYLYTSNNELALFTLGEVLSKYGNVLVLNDSILIRINDKYIDDIEGITSVPLKLGRIKN